jgi:hypothetical protein
MTCRVALFLPDLECAGDLDCYCPSGVLDGPESAVTVCSAHLGWMIGHRGDAEALGLVSADQLEVVTVSRSS